MVNALVLHSGFWDWVESHINDDTAKLRLKYQSMPGDIDYDLAITQIECRHKFAKKLHETISCNPHFLFPSRLAGEQATSDLLAKYHSTLIIKNQPLADLTSGLGIDVLHCSQYSTKLLCVEQSETIARALSYNAHVAGIKNIDIINNDCREVLKDMSGYESGTIFIDPARRGADGARLFALSDCEPNVIDMLPTLSNKCSRLIVKMSPMLDIAHTVNAMEGCNRIIVLGTAKECKELIAIKEFNHEASIQPDIDCVTLSTDGDECVFSFSRNEEAAAASPEYCMPTVGDFIYEPYPAVMKACPSKLLSDRYGTKSFHPNTHLYHSHESIADFPGLRLKIIDIIDYSSKNIKQFKKSYPVINVATRNFGISAEALKQKLGIRDGGDKRVIGITDNLTHRYLIVTERAGY